VTITLPVRRTETTHLDSNTSTEVIIQ
jgi:hypothetical protein